MSGLCSSPRVHPGLEQDWALHPRWTDDDGSGAHGHTRGSSQRPAPWWRRHFHRLVHYAGLGGRTFSDDRSMEQFHRHSLELSICPERDVNTMLPVGYQIESPTHVVLFLCSHDISMSAMRHWRTDCNSATEES
jgi:hypothetical protein